MVNTEYFYGIENKTKQLLPIFEKYNYFDLVKACFCINICIGNRSTLESGLALNQTLLEVSTGEKRILTYEEFSMFFKEIESILAPGSADDYTIEDFGEVKLRVNNKTYNVITGTGHNHVFACLYLLPYLADLTNNTQKLIKVMEYHSGIIEFFKDINSSKMDEQISFELPSAELFYRTQDFYKHKLKEFDLFTIEGVVNQGDIYIEKRHFIDRDDSIYPVFNSAILIDIYDIWYKKLETKMPRRLVETCIIDILSCFDAFDKNNYSFLFPATIVEDEKPVKEVNISFVVHCKKGTIIAINEDGFTKEELDELINDIEVKHKNEQLQFIEKRSRNNDNQCLGVSIFKEEKIEFIVYNSFSNIEDTYMQLGERNEKRFKCTALDLIEYLLFIDDFNELFEYIEYDFSIDYDQILLFGGDSGRFFSWKEQNHMMAKGAIKFGMVSLGHNSENDYIYSYFKDVLCDFPWGSRDFMFTCPFVWKIRQVDNGFWEYVNKYAKGFGEIVKHVKNGCILFFVNNIEFYKDIENPELYLNAIPFLDDLNIRLVASCESVFESIKSLSSKILELMFMPNQYADRVSTNIFNKDRKYVFSEANFEGDSICIRYAANINKLYKDISDTDCRDVEVRYFKELFSALEEKMPNEYELICNRLEELSNDKKMVDAVAIEIDYLWNENSARFFVKDQAYLMVKKNIANICFEHEIEPGEYYGSDANKVIRKMQKTLVSDFESYVSKFSCVDLHTVLLELYSEKTHSIDIHKKRYNAFDDIDDKVLEDIRQRIIKEREEYKHQLRVLNYAIETNLFLQNESEMKITDHELEYLLAYSNWLVVLSDNADIFHFTEEEAYIVVSFEYVVDVYENETRNKEFGDVTKRVYDDSGYAIAGDEQDFIFIEKLKSAFKQDVGFEWIDLLDVMNCLQRFISEQHVIEVRPNVYFGKYENVVNNIVQEMGDKINRIDVENILNYLTLDSGELKTCNGKTDFYLPIGQRKTRDNRFEVKCIWIKEDNIIFSPPVISDVQKRWIGGSLDFYLPYEKGLSCTKKIITEWKAMYEKRIVYDISDIFKNAGFTFIKPNLELCKIDKTNKHPQYLGDYDVFVVDSDNKNIWMIECKVIEKVGSFYEMYRQQNRFFYEHKEDEMFQRRIDYMKEHYPQILEFYGFDSSEKYTLCPYMVMNKVLVSRYKKLEFPIISFSELRNKIEA
ncbi:MAG: hypothetical protein ACERLG_00205 [Sedimentibacter sp.]